MTMPQNSISDLWWLESKDASQFRWIYVGHHCPITDEDEPLQQKWFHSLTPDGELTSDLKLFTTSFLYTWKNRCENRNIYRSLKVFSSEEGTDVRLGPFLVDIDNSSWDEDSQGYQEDLEDAWTVTRNAVHVLMNQWGVGERDFKVLFTGRKGFNLEVKPISVGITGTYMSQLQSSHAKFWEFIEALTGQRSTTKVSKGGTGIDAIYGNSRMGPELRHPFVRLDGSLNVWMTNNGEQSRKKIPITLAEIHSSNIQDILFRATDSA